MFHRLIATVLCALLPAVALASQRGDVFRHAKASTVLIVAVNETTHSVSLGSGFFVDADGLLVTNAHVIEDSQRLHLYVRDQFVYSTPEVVAIDADLDLAAVRIKSSGVDALILAEDLPAEGTEVIAVGYSRIQDILQMGFALHPTISTGTVGGVAEGRSRANGRPVSFIQTTGVLNFGNSGGPLVREDSGEVAGMLVQTVPFLEKARDQSGAAIGSVRMQSGIGYSIPASVIRQWLSSHDLIPRPISGPPRAVRSDDRGWSGVAQVADRSFATGHLLYTIAMAIHEDADLLNLAIRHYEAAAARHPDAPWVSRNIGLAYASVDRWSQALAAYLNALKHTPYDADLHTDAGFAWQRTGHPAPAVESYRAAIRLNPHAGRAHNYLGTLLMEKGQLDDAVLEFHHALESEPTSALAAYNLGLVLEAKGLREDAMATWESFLQKGGAVPDQGGWSLKIREAAARLKHAADPSSVTAVPTSAR